jgi:outer membrane receptor protein involved in Fe transport
VDAQYHFVNARFQTGIYKGNRIPLVSENIIRAGIDWPITKNWQVYAETLYTSSQYSDSDNANIAGLIGGYTTFGFNIRYQYLNFSAALHANNIFNKNYYFYTVYQTSMAEQFFYPAPGRNFSLILNYHFV